MLIHPGKPRIYGKNRGGDVQVRGAFVEKEKAEQGITRAEKLGPRTIDLPKERGNGEGQEGTHIKQGNTPNGMNQARRPYRGQGTADEQVYAGDDVDGSQAIILQPMVMVH
jgi:hypothetical protein